MKTSKRLLSFVLAVVMALTACSAGFAAFAQEVNPADNSPFSAENASAKGSVTALNQLVNDYLPEILELIGEDKLEGMGISLQKIKDADFDDEDIASDAFYELMSELSVPLFGLFGNKELTDIVTAENGLSFGDASFDREFYSYLEDEDATINFWTMYSICRDNADENGSEFEKLCYKYLNGYTKEDGTEVKGLGELLAAEKTLFANASGTFTDLYSKLLELCANIGLVSKAGNGVYYNLSAEEIQQRIDAYIAENGEISITEDEINTFAAGINAELSFFSETQRAKTLGDIIYYYIVNQYATFAGVYNECANIGGADYSDQGIEAISYDTWYDVLSAMLPFETFKASYQAPADYTDDDIMAVYLLNLQTAYFYMFAGQNAQPGASPEGSAYFHEIILGYLAKYNISTVEESKATLDSYYITGEQYQGLKDANLRGSSAFISYIVNDEGNLGFSQYFKSYINSLRNSNDYRNAVRNYDPETNPDPFAAAGLKDAVYNYFYKSFAYNTPNQGYVTQTVDAYMFQALIQNDLAEYAYDYDNYPIDGKYMIDLVNTTINGYVNMIKDLNKVINVAGIDINSIINSVLAALLQTKDADGNSLELADIAEMLTDVYVKLAKDPVSTIANLLPLLTVLIDELLVPLFLNDDSDAYGNDFIYSMLTKDGELLSNISPDAFNTVKALFDENGINTLNFDLNYILPTLLHYIGGDESLASGYYEGVTTEDGRNVPVITNIRVADEWVANNLYNLKVLDGINIEDMPELNDGIKEAVTEIVSILTITVDSYLDGNDAIGTASHRYDAKIGTSPSGAPATICKGLNNLGVALPLLIDTFGKIFINKYGMDSDWQFGCRIASGSDNSTGTTLVTVENATLTDVKEHVFDKNPDASNVTSWLVQLIVSDWLNAAIDFANDLFATSNDITNNLPIISSLLNSLGGFGEESIVSDIVNGFFALTRTNDYNFALAERSIPCSTDDSATYMGFSEESAYFLIANVNPIVRLILDIVDANKATPEEPDTPEVPVTPEESNNSIDVTININPDIYTQEHIQAANELLDTVDSILSALLENTYLNGYTVNKVDGILSGVVTFLVNHLGKSTTDDLIGLLKKYLELIVAESTINGYAPSRNTNSNGPVDAKKVYSKKNLSILVTQTYVLVEEILNQLLTIKGDDYNCIRGAVKGVLSPSAVAIRSDVISEDVMDYLNWTDINASKYATDLGYDNLKAGDKETFYNDLFDSLGAITAIVGTLFCTTGYYNNVFEPIVATICDACGVKDYVTSLDTTATGEDALMAIFKPVSGLVNQFLQTPATTLMQLINGIEACLDDDVINKVINGAINPLFNEIRGAGVIASNLSPTLGGIVVNFIDGLKDLIDTVIPKKDIVITLLNMVLEDYGIEFPPVDWSDIADCEPGLTLLVIYNIAIDIILDKDVLKLLLGEKNTAIIQMLSKLDSSDVLNMLNEVLSITQNPTEIYWTFESYLSKATNTFTYPSGITKSEADDAVDQLDELVANVFPLLQSFGVLEQGNLTEVVSDLLFTNDMLTKIATGVYGAIENKAAGKFTFSPAQLAAYLTDKSYGNTYTSAANALKKCSSWSQVKNINWGFKDGSAKAEQGFINGLAALCRPVNDVLAVFLADGKLDISLLTGILKDLEIGFNNNGDKNAALRYSITLIDGVLNVYLLNTTEKTAEPNRIQVNLIDILNSIDLSLYGSNGYESAIIPLLEAFMCDNIKSYSQYIKDYGKAKDNLIINVLNPLFGFVDDVLAAPFDTITKVLPNLAYFIDNNGLEKAVNNLIAPLTQVLIKALNDNGLNVDKLVNEIVKGIKGKDINGLLADALGSDLIKLNLNDITTLNIKDIVIPLVNSLLKQYNIVLPDFKWSTLASHGTQKNVSSAARNANGSYSAIRIVSNQGETLVAVLRYISDALISNASSIKKLICSIEGVAKNKTIVSILTSVFNQISTAHKDQIVQAVFYLLTQEPQNTFFDYRGFKYKDYDFSYPSTVDVEFLTVIGPMLDGLVGGLVEGGLNSLISGLIYKDSIISDLAVGLYGAIEGVKINDSMNLTQLLAKTDIDFTTDNVAKLLKDKDYGTTYSSAAKVIEKAGSWSKVNKNSLSWGVTDRDSFLHALCAVLRPIYGVLDVLLNDGSLGLFDLIYLPGSDGYTSAIVPLMEAFGLYNIKTQYQYRQDMSKEYDAILLDILNPLMDKVEDLLNAPIEVLADMLPNLSLFFANDGLLQLIENLMTPINALLKSLQPVVDVNDLLKTLGLDIEKEISKLGLNVKNFHFDIYDLAGSLKPLIGADNIVGLLNSVLGLIKIGGQSLNLELMPIDWYQLASHGTVITNEASQAATFGGRVYVKADASEVLIAVLRYLINTVNYKDNFSIINNLISGLIGGASESVSGVVSQVLGMLTGDTDDVISELCNLLQTLA